MRGIEAAVLCDDPRQRKPLESINRSTTPWTFELDLRVDKSFDLYGVETTAYMYVYNLLNRQNIINVYDRSGNAEDDGFLSNPELSSSIIEASGGLTYQQMYEAINLANRQHYWFDQGGRRLTSDHLAKFYLTIDAIGTGRTDGALVRFITPILPGQPIEAADARLAALIGEALPVLPRFIETDVPGVGADQE